MLARSKYLPFLMWLFPLLFFTYQFVLRLWPGLMMNQIMEQFSIEASYFGLLAALYYYGYAAMQIPAAMLLDRFGARYIVFAFAVICGVATFTFTFTSSWFLACLSRFLIGAGSAVGFLGVSKVVSEWFPKEDYAKMVGFSFSVALMGAIYGGKPISVLIEIYSWQKIALALAVLSMAIGFASYLFLRSPGAKNQTASEQGDAFQLSHFKTLLSSPVIWLIAFANFFMVGALEGFADIWGVAYLMKAYSLAKGDAAGLVSFVFVGMLFGGPLLAFLSQKIGKYSVIALCGFGMALAFLLLISGAVYNWYSLSVLFFLVGIMCCYQVIVFAVGSDLVRTELLGVTVAFLNCMNMLGGSFFHTTIGYVMDIFWTGTYHLGARAYELESYKAALMVIPLCSILGAAMISFVGLRDKKFK